MRLRDPGISSANILTDRICDLNGDGLGDNAVADLGSPAAELLAGIFDSLFAGEIDDGSRSCAHFPWVDDVVNGNDPEMTLIFFHAEDTDFPVDPSDDYSGTEPFTVKWDSIDVCGEPRFFFVAASLEEGVLSGEGGFMPFFLRGAPPARGAHLFGSLHRRGAGAEMSMCGYLLASELGASPGLGDDLSLLEALLAGGAARGVPSLSGLSLDLDLDGDGLERFETDAEGRITTCIDGDNATIEGADCWADPRIADALSISVAVSGLPAQYAGLSSHAEAMVRDECPEGPPGPSLWDPR